VQENKMTDEKMKKTRTATNEEDLNRDPLSGTPGAHPIGTTGGAASGAVAGGAAGLAVGGPIGGLVGIAAGAVAGGLAGKGVAEMVNPTEEEEYWKDSYRSEPYYMKGKPYEHYAPAYRTGWEGRVLHDGHSFEEAESDLIARYNQTRTEDDVAWNDVKPAVHAAWDRVDHNRHSKPGERLNKAFATNRASPGDPGQLPRSKG